VGSPNWIAECASKVNDFRKALPPEESELFNECLMRICRNPHEDGVHKFRARTGFPLVMLIYRDDNFMLMYYLTQASNPNTKRKVYVLRAARTGDFDK
jgi:hypothetical protein